MKYQESPRTTVPAAPGSAHRILVVDDDEDIRRLNAGALTHSGYDVTTAEDGAAAWDALQIEHYDLLLTDHNMPRITGIELLQKLHTAQMTMPVIMVSGTIPTEELKRHPWLQIHATLLKPYSFDDLLEKVRNVLCLNASDAARKEVPRTLVENHDLQRAAPEPVPNPAPFPLMSQPKTSNRSYK